LITDAFANMIKHFENSFIIHLKLCPEKIWEKHTNIVLQLCVYSNLLVAMDERRIYGFDFHMIARDAYEAHAITGTIVNEAHALITFC